MRGAKKVDAPLELLNWIALANENWRPSYPFNNAHVRAAVVASLKSAQRGLCVYCGRKLNLTVPGKTYHVEHFRPQNTPDQLYSHLDVDFSNLFLSCGQEDSNHKPAQTCGTHKGNSFNELYAIEPKYPDCTRRFNFLPSGEIEPSSDDDEAAKFSINLLRLDHIELKTEREQLLFLLDAEEIDLGDLWEEAEQTASSLAHVAFAYLGKELP